MIANEDTLDIRRRGANICDRKIQCDRRAVCFVLLILMTCIADWIGTAKGGADGKCQFEFGFSPKRREYAADPPKCNGDREYGDADYTLVVVNPLARFFIHCIQVHLHLIGIGRDLTIPLLPHHRAYGSRTTAIQLP